MTDLRGSDTRSDEEAGFRFFETTINGIVWLSLCSLFYALFFAYGPMVVAVIMKNLGITSLPVQLWLVGVPFLIAFMLWPAFSVVIYFWNYLPKVMKAIDRPELAKVNMPDWMGTAMFLGFMAGLLAFMVVLAGAAFYQSWVALGQPELSITTWFDRLGELLNSP